MSVFFSRIFLLYSFAAPFPAEFCMMMAAYHLCIIERAFSTNIIPFPGAEYGGLRMKASAGKCSSVFQKPYFPSNLSESLLRIFELPSHIIIMLSIASM